MSLAAFYRTARHRIDIPAYWPDSVEFAAFLRQRGHYAYVNTMRHAIVDDHSVEDDDSGDQECPGGWLSGLHREFRGSGE